MANLPVTDRDREAAEEAVSAANIVSHDGYYEADTDKVVLIFARHAAEVREECARVAEGFFDNSMTMLPSLQAKIAAAIRESGRE